MHDGQPGTPKYGVMICGHGSRSKSAVTEFAVLAEKLAPMFPEWPVEYGYLEFATPVIKTGLDNLRAQGVTHVLAVPGMLFAAGHANNPRRAIHTHAQDLGWVSSYTKELYSKWMHDETNIAGLNFVNKRGDKWRAYGDGCMLFEGNAKNLQIEAEALAKSLQRIIEVAKSQTDLMHRLCLADQDVLDLVPDTNRLWDPQLLKEDGNMAQMFTSPTGDYIMMRGNRECQWFGADYNPFCDTSDFETQGVDEKGRGPSDPCRNKVTGNTFSSVQGLEPPCTESGYLEHWRASMEKHGEVCTPAEEQVIN